MKTEDLIIYSIAMEQGEKIWTIVMGWDYFSKDTFGKQIVKTADSIAANISEGMNRFHFRETRQFLYISRGSLAETKTWLQKALFRNLIQQEQFDAMNQQFDSLGVKIYNFIRTINRNILSDNRMTYSKK
jgi:four helix bundle protein